MRELLSFLKNIFMISDENSTMKVGLSQFKDDKSKDVELRPTKRQKDIKLSDLMRKSA